MDCCHHEEKSKGSHVNHADDHCHPQHGKWKASKALWITSLLFLVVFALSFLPFFEELNHSLIHYIHIMWWAILLGLFMGGLIDYFVPSGFIITHIGESSIRSLFYGIVGGFLLSVCSHGILAIAMQLHKKGAAVAVIMSFLLAAPWANLVITILLFSFFGWKAIWFIVAALFVAFVTGFIFMMIERNSKAERIEPQTDYNWDHIKNFNLNTALNGVKRGILDLSNMVLWWMMIGIISAAVINAYVPKEIFIEYFGPELKGLLTTLGVATVIEVCSEGSAPIAFEIYEKLQVIGNPFVFLMAGVVTDFTEIGMIWTNMGKKPAILLPLIAVPMILIIAILFNQFL